MTQEELDQLHTAFSDAMDRVIETEQGERLVEYTRTHQLHEVQAYLEVERISLTPEELHFLQMTVAVRVAANQQKLSEGKVK